MPLKSKTTKYNVYVIFDPTVRAHTTLNHFNYSPPGRNQEKETTATTCHPSGTLPDFHTHRKANL